MQWHAVKNYAQNSPPMVAQTECNLRVSLWLPSEEALNPAAILVRPELRAVTPFRPGFPFEVITHMPALDVAALAEPKGRGHHPAPARKAFQHMPTRYEPVIRAIQTARVMAAAVRTRAVKSPALIAWLPRTLRTR
jgi:hypothetical protein